MDHTFQQRLTDWAAKYKLLTGLEERFEAERRAGRDTADLQIQVRALRHTSEAMLKDALQVLRERSSAGQLNNSAQK